MQLNQKTLVITDIGSYLGLRATERAIAQGIAVRGLASTITEARQAEARGARVRVGSLADTCLVRQVCAGADLVWHLCSSSDVNASEDQLYQVNVANTLNVARQAQQTGVQAFLHLSTVIVYGPHYPDQVTEAQPVKPVHALSQARLAGEQQLLKQFATIPDFGVTVIRAGDVYGPEASSWVVRPLELMQKGRFFLIDGGQGIMNHVYIDNLIDSFFLAMEQKAYGEIFNITDGARTTWKEFYNRLADLAGQPCPSALSSLAAKAAVRIQGKAIGVTPEVIDLFSRKHTYSITKAHDVLGYVPQISLSQGMAHISDWLKSSRELTHCSASPI